MKMSLQVVTAGKAAGQMIPITLAQFIIGRDPECNLRPSSAMISKKHCAILVRQGQVFLRDFGSTNGTFLNDQPVKGEVGIKNDDVLKVGPLEFKVKIEQTKPAAKVSPPPATKPAVAPAKAPAESAPEDDIAAMLLSLPGEDGGEPGLTADGEVPSGSTVFDYKVPPEGQQAIEAAVKAAEQAAKPAPEPAAKTPVPPGKGEPAKGPEKKEEKKPEKSVDARDAARAILEKYSRRGRG